MDFPLFGVRNGRPRGYTRAMLFGAKLNFFGPKKRALLVLASFASIGLSHLSSVWREVRQDELRMGRD